MLAHKATHEGKVAAEVIAGENVAFDARAIPNVAYTDPEVAWTGLTETQAKAEGIEYETARSRGPRPAARSAMGRGEGMTKLLVEPGTRRILGAGIVGVNAGELIAEAVLALEMGADAEDIGAHDPPAPDAVRDARLRRRGRRGHDHRPHAAPRSGAQPPPRRLVSFCPARLRDCRDESRSRAAPGGHAQDDGQLL